MSLDDLLAWAYETYDEAFSPRLFVQQLTYTADLPDRNNALARLVNPLTFDTVTTDLMQIVRHWSARRFHPEPPQPQGPYL